MDGTPLKAKWLLHNFQNVFSRILENRWVLLHDQVMSNFESFGPLKKADHSFVILLDRSDLDKKILF